MPVAPPRPSRRVPHGAKVLGGRSQLSYASPTVTQTRIITLGPIEGLPPDRAILVAPLSAAVRAQDVVFASDALVGLRQVLDGLGHRDVTCEPGLAEAAHALGLPVAPLDLPELELRADLALALDDPSDLPSTHPPHLRSYLLRGLAALRPSPAWTYLDEGGTARFAVEGQTAAGRCDAFGSISFGFVPETHLHVVSEGPAPFDLLILSAPGPSHAVEALSRAYGLPFRPALRLDDAMPPPEWLTQWGPAIGAALYLLGLLGPGETHKSLTMSDPAAVQLACEVALRGTL